MGRTDHPRREAWLDGLKGFGSLLVILGHVLSGYLDAGAFPEAYASLYTVRSWIYSFHMPLFFLVSGFTFTLAYWPEGRLRKQAFFRQLFNLFWLYVIFALLQWGVKQAVPELVNEVYDLTTLQRMFVEPLGNFWYIYVLFLLYCLSALLQLPRWSGLWLLLPVGGAIVAADVHLDWTYLTAFRLIYHLAFFTMGMALCRRRDLLEKQKLLGLAAMFMATAAFFYWFRHTRYWYGNWRFGIALSTCWIFLWAFRRCRPLAENRLLQLLGKHCLELYLLHTFFTAGLRSLLPLLGLQTAWPSVIVNFLLSTGISLALAVLAGRFPFMDYLFRPARAWANRRKR